MRPRRMFTICAAALAALAIGGCGPEEVVTEGGTEGIWVDVGPLNYQVQGSRLLEPGNQEPDQSYLKGIAKGVTDPTADELWFAVFLRVENKTRRAERTVSEFEITDTDGNIFKPITIDTEANPFAYKPLKLEPDNFLPAPDSVQELDSKQGPMLLFKLPLTAYANRPLMLKISGDGVGGPREAQVNLDV